MKIINCLFIPTLNIIKRKVTTMSASYQQQIKVDHPIYQPEKDRYHLYVSLACPWASRCLATMYLKGLQAAVGVSIVHPTWQRTRPNDPEDMHTGWVFNTGALPSAGGFGSIAVPRCTLDTVNKADSIRDVYELNKDTFKKYSVPILWDKKTNSIVNNESAEILRILAKEFDAYATGPYASYDLYPEALRPVIDAANEWIYSDINNGVYKCGFAKTQEAYNEAVERLFVALDRLEELLSHHRYVAGSTLTEADIRLLMSLVRFDEVRTCMYMCI